MTTGTILATAFGVLHSKKEQGNLAQDQTSPNNGNAAREQRYPLY